MNPALRLDALLLSLVAMAWLPANHYQPWPSAWQEGPALSMLALAAAAASTRAGIARPWLLAIAIALLSVVAQAGFGQLHYAGDAWMVALYLVAFAVALAMGGTLPDDDAHAKPGTRLAAVCTGVVFAALVSAGIGFAQWADVQGLGIFGVDLPPGSRPFANLAQPNHWCTASVIGLGCAWALYEDRRLAGPVFALVAAVMLAAMVMSGSRTAWLQMALAVALYALLRHRARLRLSPLAVVSALALLALAWLAWPALQDAAASGTARSLSSQAQAGVRVPLWTALLGAIAERPWAGYGWQQMVLAQQAVALQGPPLRIHFEHAHNLVLDLALWVGVPLALLLLALLAWPLPRLLRGTDPRLPALLMVVGAVALHSMVEFAVEYAYFLVPAGLMLGAAHRLVVPSGGTPVPRTLLRGTGWALALALAITAFDYLRAEQSYRTLRLEAARIGAARTAPEPAPDLRVLTQLQALLDFARQTPRPGLSAAEIEVSRRAAERFAYPPAQFRHAQVLALNGDAAGAQHMLALLCAMHPRARCQEAVDGWAALARDKPELAAVALPDPAR